jgi:hypothetical protein
MLFQGHVKTSAIAGTVSGIVAYQYEPKTAFYMACIAFIGGLFPDLDTESKPSKYAARAGVVSSLLLLNSNPKLAALIGILFMLAKVDRHRGWTHNPILPILLAFAGNHYGYFHQSLAFGLGIYAHLLSDSKAFKNIGK